MKLLPFLFLFFTCFLPNLANSSESENTQASPQVISQTNPQNIPQKIHYVFDPDWAPFEWKDDKESHVGIVADLLNLISQQTQIEFIPVSTETWDQSITTVKNQQAEMFSAITVTEERKQYLNFTQNDIYRYPAVLISPFDDKSVYLDIDSDLDSKVVGIVAGSGLGEFIKEQHPNVQFKEVKSTHTGFESLRNGDIDLFAINAITAKYYIEKNGFDDLKIVYKLDYQYQLKIGFRKEIAKEFIEKIDQAIANISPYEFNLIVQKWTSQQRDQEDTITYLVYVLLFAALLISVLAFYNWQLKRMVAHRTLELQKNNKILQKNQKQQQRLFAIIGHELRTPAAAMDMILNSQYLDKEKLKETSQHLLTVLDDMRVVIHPQDAIKGKTITSSVYGVIHSAIAYQDRLLQESNLQVYLDASECSKERCSINAQLLRQISLNMIKNCALHSSASKMWISIKPLTDVPFHYEVRFEDNGRGIPREHQAVLFNAFVRGETDADGTGLGLHLSRQFAQEQFKGELRYKDRVGGGACFILSMQLNAPVIVEEEIDSEQNALQGKRVLLAEDNQLIRIMTKALLEQKEVLVDLAENGAEAFELSEQHHYDLVITDIFMPEMDGYELTQLLRKNGFKSPIFGISAATVGEEMTRLKQLGANEVISKPVDIDLLLNLFARYSLQK